MTRKEAETYIIQHCNPDYPKGKTEWERAMNMAIEALQQPEVIRCEDCRWWERESISEGHCLEIDLHHVDEDHYCGYAERKEGEADG